MENINRLLAKQGYSNTEGFFTRATGESHMQSEAEKVWSALAQDNPIHAAAAATTKDWYTKYPRLIDQEIEDERKVILDAGCGYGRVAIPLLRARQKLKLIGVDASTVMLHTFLDLLETGGISELKQRLILLHSTINQLPFPEETFDYIYSCAVLLHNPYEDVQEILKEFYRLLKPSGKLVLAGSFPNVWNLEGIQNCLYSNWFASPHANGPVRAYTRTKVEQLFNDWKEIDIVPTGVTVLPRQIAKIPMPLGGLIRRVNGWLEEKNFAFLSYSSLLIKYFDVIAQK
jgi:ubiquinone/menaquinone biosynthesis C-methylase UbiE